ncbi:MULTISPECIES: MFS transporter [Pseudomonas syringae group]|uniref:MFS transporter n=4 Tax=Pseudomonas syringae group TaxID=136849 RepID=A0AAD0GNP3_9PSED|nr:MULTISPECIES: MFS transporter [Pseudomonas syringae group]AVB20090.1 MFS transporter [Pseudomonas avellanae]EGH09451.1 mutlidrug resistance protein [Pseudomonas amygdali pv. morsprunorum str. M302280]KWS68646.1 MFS transporter [Pseudomonas amygdali pv. morsprunorum]PHN41024.1 MFS transporter [Pseudomonas avellanae]POC94244.1 MFS transporter [Pseudomonas avellanae]
MSRSLSHQASRGQEPETVTARSHLGFLAFTTLCFFAASSTPTPLYHLYQEAWGFSSGVLTLIFAVYAFSLLAALLMGGSLSDYLGRRPVIFGALLLQIVSMLLFIFARDVTWLVAARLLQGFATGLAASALGAALLDSDQAKGPLINSISPMLGMAVGALGTALLVQWAPLPLMLAYCFLLAAFVIQAIYLGRVAETVSRQPGVWQSLKPSLHVPQQARRMLWLVLPVDIAAWALGGFFLSLSPSLLAAATGSTSPLNGGLAVAALTLSGALAIVTLRQREPVLGLWVGASFLPLGVAVILLAVNLGALWLFFVGAVVAGIGFGSSFLGALRMLMPLAHAHERAGLMSAFLVLSYLAFCIPALIAGYFAHSVGLVMTSNVYGAVVITLALIALAGLIVRRAAGAKKNAHIPPAR